MDGKIIIGGSFTTFNGLTRNRIARLKTDGSLDLTFITPLGADNSIHTSSIQTDGKIIIGGSFTSYNGNGIKRIARVIGFTDNDGDGISNEDDNCTINANADQADADGDGRGDVCDGCPDDPGKYGPGDCGCGVEDTDTDEDGISDCIDNCPNTFNADQTDTDNDGIGDACDNCTNVSNADQADSDCDGPGDPCDVCSGGDDSGPCNATSLPPLYQLPAHWLCSNNNNSDKILICHEGTTLCVSENAANMHLSHGDFLGPCTTCPQNYSAPLTHIVSKAGQMPVFERGSEDAWSIQARPLSGQIHIYPNPASEQIQIVLPEGSQEGTLRILSLTGQEIQALHFHGHQSITFDLSDYAPGVYLIDVRSASGHCQKKFVKL